MLDLLSGFFFVFFSSLPLTLFPLTLCPRVTTSGPFSPSVAPSGVVSEPTPPLRCATPALVVCFLYFWANASQGDRLSVRP